MPAEWKVAARGELERGRLIAPARRQSFDFGFDQDIVQTGRPTAGIDLERSPPARSRLVEPALQGRQRGEVVLDQGAQSRVGLLAGGIWEERPPRPNRYPAAVPSTRGC